MSAANPSNNSSSGAVAGSLLSGKAQSDAMNAIGRGDTEKALALLALTAPAGSTPLFDSVLFCEAVDTCHFDLAHAMLAQAPFRTGGDLGASLLQSVRATTHRSAEALPLVDQLLDAMRSLGAEECASLASGGYFESIYSTAASNAPEGDFESDEEVMDEEGNWVKVVPKKAKYSARRSLLAFKKEFSPSRGEN